MTPPPPTPPTAAAPTTPKSPGVRTLSALWSKREAECANGRGTMPAAPGAYPFSPRKLRSVVSAAVSNNTEQQKVRRTKKIYFPANTNESTIIGALQGTVSGNAKVSKTPISPNRSKSMGTYTLNVPRPVCLLHKSQSLPVKKTVSFGRKDHIREIEMVGDIPEDVVADLWWSAREYTEIRKEFEAVLFLLDTEKPIDEDENSSRGLHKRTETGAWILYENQRNARNAVLLQQDLQRKNKVTDAVEIAKAYLKESIKMRDEAVQQAAADAAAVQEFLFFAKQQQRSDPKRTNKHQAEGLSADTTHLRNKPHHASRRRAPAVFNDSIAHIGAYKSGKKAISTDDTLLDMSSKDTQSPEVRLFRNLSNDDSIEVLAKSSNKDTFHDAPKFPDKAAEKVRFSKKVKTIKSRKVNDLDKDKKKRWYSKKELQKIEFAFGVVVEMMEKGGIVMDGDIEEEKDETRRGLEKSTEDGAWKLYERRRDALNAVLVLQEQQRKDKLVDPVALADTYAEATKEACKEAVKFGKQDAKEAKKYRLRRRTLLHCSGAPSPPPLQASKSAEEDENKMAHSTDESGDEQVITIKVNEKSTTTKPRRVSCSDEPDRRGLVDDTECGDLSGRSLLHLDDDDPHAPTEVPIERCTLRRRLSTSHAPSRRFVFAAAAAFENKRDIKDHSNSSSKHPKKSKPERLTWARRKTVAADPDKSESASVYEDIVTEIVVSSAIAEPDDVTLAIVQHVYAAPSSYRENETIKPPPATDKAEGKDQTSPDAIDMPQPMDSHTTRNGFPTPAHVGNSDSIVALDPGQGSAQFSAPSVGLPVVETGEHDNRNDETGERASPVSVFNDMSKSIDDISVKGESTTDPNSNAAFQEPVSGIYSCGKNSRATETVLSLPQGDIERSISDATVAFKSSSRLRNDLANSQCESPSEATVPAPILFVDGKTDDADISTATVDPTDGVCALTPVQPSSILWDGTDGKDDALDGAATLQSPAADEFEAETSYETTKDDRLAHPVGEAELVVHVPHNVKWASVSAPEQMSEVLGYFTSRNAGVADDTAVISVEDLKVESESKSNAIVARESDSCSHHIDHSKHLAGGQSAVVDGALTVPVPENLGYVSCDTTATEVQIQADERATDAPIDDTAPVAEDSIEPISIQAEIEPIHIQAESLDHSDKPGRADLERIHETEDSKSKCSTVSTRDSTKSPSVVDTSPSDADNPEDASIWFKVRSKDVIAIQLEDGRVLYLLDNAEKCTEAGAWDQWM